MRARAQSGRGQYVPGTECNGIRMEGEAAKLRRGSCQSMRAFSRRATGSQGVTAREASSSSLCLWAEHISEVAGMDCRWGWLLISIFRISLESNGSHLRTARHLWGHLEMCGNNLGCCCHCRCQNPNRVRHGPPQRQNCPLLNAKGAHTGKCCHWQGTESFTGGI